MKFLILDVRGDKVNYLYRSFNYFSLFYNLITTLFLIFTIDNNLKHFLVIFKIIIKIFKKYICKPAIL